MDNDLASGRSIEELTPVASSERIAALDAIRGFALFGVLLVNAVTGFRLSLFAHILQFHSHADSLNRLVDVLIAGMIEFKAIALFTILFGVGIGVQAERTASRSRSVSAFLVRRFLVLFMIGVIHMFLIWNGDILVLYAVCGLLITPLLRLPIWLLVVLGVAAIISPIELPYGGLSESGEVLRAHAALATRIYSEGTPIEILVLRWNEAWHFIVPLLIGTLPKTLGLMLFGVAAWRSGIARSPASYRRLLWTVLTVGGLAGGAATFIRVYSRSTGHQVEMPALLDLVSPDILLGLAYGAGLLLFLRSARSGVVLSSVRAAGQMALTNYISQSAILSLVFYSYGLGFFGRFGSAIVTVICVVIYAAQLALSRAWLLRWRFGPVEWLWRSLTYGNRQPMLRR